MGRAVRLKEHAGETMAGPPADPHIRPLAPECASEQLGSSQACAQLSTGNRVNPREIHLGYFLVDSGKFSYFLFALTVRGFKSGVQGVRIIPL